MISSDLINQAEQGNLEALVQLDANGMLLGREESLPQYAERLRALQRNTAQMEDELQRHGTFAVEGVTVQSEWRIPAALFAEAQAQTERLYAFRAEWVPGFFINPRYSLLFGGCSFYFHPDFFVLFIIRRVFATRSRWLIYNRQELLAHEMCHVARIALEARRFEETFAYQTATSPFRRLAGSICRSEAAALWFLGSALGLLLAQLVQSLFWPALPVWPFWGLTVGVILTLALQLLGLQRLYGRALRQAEWLAPGQAQRLLFRCTDEEVEAIAHLPSPEAAQSWLASRCQAQVRWQVIQARFLAAQGVQRAPFEPVA